MSLIRRLLGFSLLFVLIITPGVYQSDAAGLTKLYIGHSARLTAQIPDGWTVDPTGTFDYSGVSGFVRRPIPGQTLDDACTRLATSLRPPIFDSTAATTRTTWDGQDACRVVGEIGGAGAAAIVTAHPYPFSHFDDLYSYVALIADSASLVEIAATVDFAPDRVTPETYARSLQEIAEARAYWGEEVDWPTVRQQVFSFVEGLPTVEMARQGILNLILQHLRLAGDNHSFFFLPRENQYLMEPAFGFGFLVADHRVVAVFPDGPADRAGLRAGDFIETIQGSPYLPQSIPVDPIIVASSGGTESSVDSVEWTVQREGESEPITIAITQGLYSRYLPPTGRRLAGEIGYIQVPDTRTPGTESAFAAAGNQIVAEIDKEATCGWIVDLRINRGGGYSPMITAVGSILGNGIFVGWRSRDGSQDWVTYQDGRITQNGKEVSDYLGARQYTLLRPTPPVVVLTSSLTGSAGEVTTLAFVGRPDTTIIGEKTAGLTSAGSGHFLFDGSVLSLVVAAMTDRTGMTHLDGIQPHQPVTIEWGEFGAETDPLLTAATEWLNQQPQCRTVT